MCLMIELSTIHRNDTLFSCREGIRLKNIPTNQDGDSQDMPIGTVISLCSGAMGFDLGFEQEGFEIRASVEKAKWAIESIKANRPAIQIIPMPLERVKTSELLAKAGLKVGEPTVVVGAPPCEPFSTAGRRNGLQDSRAIALYEFIRVVEEARPKYFAFEEVSAFVTAAETHLPFYERILINPKELKPDEQLGSAFQKVMSMFTKMDYALSYDGNPQNSIYNAADFGVPQKRRRFILIGSRDGKSVRMANPTHGMPGSPAVVAGMRLPWKDLRSALAGLEDAKPECMSFSPSWGQFLKHVPPGGCWRDLPTELQRKALGGAFDNCDDPRTRGKKGGRTGFMRRLSWENPSPTLVDEPTTKAACLCHPDQLRPLSIKEYARIQGFPDDWIFCGNTTAKYRLIGQATPTGLARAIAVAIKEAMAET
jgi:DNA (cytosine-5)-methyltransferase 1